MGFGGINNKHHHNHHHHHHHNMINLHVHLPSLHLHHQESHDGELRDVPKGCLAVRVGQGEEQQRFVIPVVHINHPLFMELLKEAEEEFGFEHKGTITIPCHVEEFLSVKGLIDQEVHFHHHHHHHVLCFRV